MTGTVLTPDEQQVDGVVDAIIEAHRRQDASALAALYAPGAVHYDLAPPLRSEPGPAGQLADTEAWWSGFAGPVAFATRDRRVHLGGDVAFVHALWSMTATPAGAPSPFTLWFRSTLGLQRIDGAWLIVHEHKSTPFHMDMDRAGNFRAATDLTP